ncbi:MAG TPA: ABC transporter permease [Polyangiaceae bacterium]|jgi:ABC-type dipeptide/oligopeptide/nickel transport system permease component|nr:ABC transporter permease [Polyangiaceae bacterium]
MIRRIASRAAASLAVVFGAVTLIFLILNWLPGDPAALIAGEGASAATIAQLRAQLGTDRPLILQYRDYLLGLLHGDLGRSYATHQPVLERLAAQLPSTVWLTLGATAVAVVVGVSLGVVAAMQNDRWIDRTIQTLALVVASIPSFWLGLLLILVFSVKLRWFPVIGDGSASAAVLPVACLGVVASVPLLRMVKSGILEGLHDPYVVTLRAKGLGAPRTLLVHVLRNALMATVTLVSVLVGELLSGAVVIETLFARQGIGRITVEAIGQKDLPVVQGAILLASIAYVVANLVVDVSYAIVDPRTRLRSATVSR